MRNSCTVDLTFANNELFGILWINMRLNSKNMEKFIIDNKNSDTIQELNAVVVQL